MDIEKLRKRYEGPMMNQDIIKCIEEIERLNKLVKDAYFEGYGVSCLDGLFPYDTENHWSNSDSKQALKEG